MAWLQPLPTSGLVCPCSSVVLVEEPGPDRTDVFGSFRSLPDLESESPGVCPLNALEHIT